MTALAREVKGGAPGQPGKPLGGVWFKLLLPCVRIIDEVIFTAELFDHRIQSSRSCLSHAIVSSVVGTSFTQKAPNRLVIRVDHTFCPRPPSVVAEACDLLLLAL